MPIFTNKNIIKLNNFYKFYNFTYMETKLKYYRKKNNFSQIQIANKLNIAQSSYSAYETGKNEPDIESLIFLSKLYHITIDELLGVSQPNLININSLLDEERNILDALSKLNKENLIKVETYTLSKLEEQKK